jgi:uncharacterized membrane protein (DUF4010 family)
LAEPCSVGTVGVYATSTVADLTDVDAITSSVTQLSRDNKLKLQVEGTVVFIPAIMKTIAKGFIAHFSGSQNCDIQSCAR